jgi:hypothetical protein
VSAVTSNATNAIIPLIRREAGALGVTTVAGTRARGRSADAPGYGRLGALAAAIRDGGPDTERAGGPEIARGNATGEIGEIVGIGTRAERGGLNWAGGGGCGTGAAALTVPLDGRRVPASGRTDAVATIGGGGPGTGGSGSTGREPRVSGRSGSAAVSAVAASAGGSGWPSKSGLALDSTDRYGEGMGRNPSAMGGHSGGWVMDAPPFPGPREPSVWGPLGTPVNSHRDHEGCRDGPTSACPVCPGRGRAAQVRAVGIGRVLPGKCW